MIRVLHVLNNLGSGGVESLLMNIYRKIDKNQIQFDFLIRSDKNGVIVDEIINLGGRVFRIAEYPRHFLKNKKDLEKFFEEHGEYTIIHVHANSLIYIRPLIFAKQIGIPYRIIHSHSVAVASGIPFLNQIHKFNRKRIGKIATHYFACSEAAGQWMFTNKRFKVINNGIDLGKIQFNPIKREHIRKEYHLDNAFIIGNVGRFSHPKNHSFTVRLFAKYASMNPDARLLLVGEGELLDEIRGLAKELAVSDKIIFAGAVNNVEDYLSAMDIFVFPSFYEGLPIALIEAQAVGLPCIASTNITQEAVLNCNCKRLSLDSPMEEWIDAINQNNVRINPSNQLQRYDINQVAKEMEAFYLKLTDCRKE